MNNYKNESERTVFIIGGGQIYKEALEQDVVDTMFITHVNKSYGADTFFPQFNLNEWRIETLCSKEKDEKHEASFTVVKYMKK